MRFVVGFVFDAFKATRAVGSESRRDERSRNGGVEVGDGVSAVLQVEPVAGWVQTVDGSQPV